MFLFIMYILNRRWNFMNYGYARCSTNEKRQDIDRQIRELLNQDIKRENIFCENQSGTKEDRTELNRLLSAVIEGDIVVATEISRITRSTQHLCQIIQLAKDKKIKLVLGSFVVDCTSNQLDAMTERNA